ncbi:MAG: CinA family nicotinamide mononucleotide deamidase-related protein [Methylovulum sp.]|nr:CinA family nicotinamide mononucleotide deamidase-related protein [Methylovulum sp.]
MNPMLEIFSQGEEIVTGHTVDTNAAWLSQQAVREGFTVSRHTAVGDKLADLVALLQEIAQRADCCLCTGGLGPTQDDLTAEAVALAFGMPLQLDPKALAQIEAFFALRGRPMPDSNRKQALLPKGSLRINNKRGTAPGFALQHQRCWFVFLPGVPTEMRPMFAHKVLPQLHQRFSLQPSALISIKTFGLGESAIQQRMDTLALPAEVQLGFRADLHEVQTKLLFPYGYPEAAMTDLVAQVVGLLGDTVFAVDSPTRQSGGMTDVVSQLMTQGQHTLNLIETASQGLLASLCGGADWLLEARYGQSLAKLAKKQGQTEAEGDSVRLAQQLAKATPTHSPATWVLVQGFDGDHPQFQDPSQAITVHTLLLADGRFHQSTHTVAGSHKRKQSQAALLSLDVLRRVLQFGCYSNPSDETGHTKLRRYGLRLLDKNPQRATA